MNLTDPPPTARSVPNAKPKRIWMGIGIVAATLFLLFLAVGAFLFMLWWDQNSSSILEPSSSQDSYYQDTDYEFSAPRGKVAVLDQLAISTYLYHRAKVEIEYANETETAETLKTAVVLREIRATLPSRVSINENYLVRLRTGHWDFEYAEELLDNNRTAEALAWSLSLVDSMKPASEKFEPPLEWCKGSRSEDLLKNVKLRPLDEINYVVARDQFAFYVTTGLARNELEIDKIRNLLNHPRAKKIKLPPDPYQLKVNGQHIFKMTEDEAVLTSRGLARRTTALWWILGWHSNLYEADYFKSPFEPNRKTGKMDQF
ncbi:hypothetical protein QPK87_01780 [Kamptonema cortianum]|nr:hypothetical protein [Geitlerinema splendidum]MDK3155315.1 hypothetical protein [Kamptonema cortianum]